MVGHLLRHLPVQTTAIQQVEKASEQFFHQKTGRAAGPVEFQRERAAAVGSIGIVYLCLTRS
jgi:hypothetical protein